MSSDAESRSEKTPFVTIPVTLRASDVVVAHFWALSRMPIVRLLVGVNGLLLLATLLFAIRALTRGEAPPLALALPALLLLVFFVLTPVFVRRRARNFYARLGEADRRGTYSFTEAGFDWTLGRSPGRAGWASVRAARETSDRVFLLTAGGRAHVLPKAEASADALARLRTLLDASASRTSC